MRRNITDAQRIQVAIELKPILEAKARVNCAVGGGDKKSKSTKSGSPDLANPIEPVNVRKELAAAVGVSGETFRKAEAE